MGQSAQPLAPDSTIIQLLKMDSKLVLAVVLLVLAGLIAPGSGLKCHQCNSYEHALCADPFHHDDGGVKSNDEFLKECGTDQEYTFCRKVYQNVRDEVRVIRSCGWIPDPKDRECYTTVLEEYNTEVCSCDGDGCCTRGSQSRRCRRDARNTRHEPPNCRLISA